MERKHEIDYGLIEDYLAQNLSESERTEVEQRIERDEHFAREVAWMRLLADKDRTVKGMKVLDAIEAIHRKRALRAKFMRIAATVTTMAAVILLGMYLAGLFERPAEIPIAESPSSDSSDANGDITTADNWQQYITYQKDLGVLGEEEEEMLGQAISLMEEGKRKEALPYLEAYFSGLPEGEEDYAFRIEAGKIYLVETRDFGKAAAQFERVVEGEAIERLKAEAKYYLALTRFAAGDRDGARLLLEELTNQPDTYWRDKAEQVLTGLLN